MISLEVIGRLGKDGEMRPIGQNQAYCFSVANDEKVNGQKVTTWIDVVFFKTNSNIIQYIKSGAMVRAIGRASWRSYTDKSGVQRVGVTVFADEVNMLVFPKRDEQGVPMLQQAQQTADQFYQGLSDKNRMPQSQQQFVAPPGVVPQSQVTHEQPAMSGGQQPQYQPDDLPF